MVRTEESRVTRSLADRALETRGPEPKARVAGKHRVEGRDVDLRVVEEGVAVEIGRAEGQSQRSSMMPTFA
jgi:hypothetical protein